MLFKVSSNFNPGYSLRILLFQIPSFLLPPSPYILSLSFLLPLSFCQSVPLELSICLSISPLSCSLFDVLKQTSQINLKYKAAQWTPRYKIYAWQWISHLQWNGMVPTLRDLKACHNIVITSFNDYISSVSPLVFGNYMCWGDREGRDHHGQR